MIPWKILVLICESGIRQSKLCKERDKFKYSNCPSEGSLGDFRGLRENAWIEFGTPNGNPGKVSPS
jgi:hypothetical protein